MGHSIGERHDRSSNDEDNHSESPEVLRARVERTREEIKETMTTIQARLSPARLKQEVRHATVGKVEDMAHSARDTAQRWSGNMMDTISQNPVPVALIGLGLAWLLKARNENSYYAGLPDYSRSYAYRNPYDPYEERESGTFDELKEKAGETVGAMREKVEDAAQTVQEKMSETADSIRQNTSALGERVKGQAHELSANMQRRAGELKYRVEDRTRRATRGFNQTFQENPWSVGAMAFSIGAAVGLSAPRTQQEDEWMGETRDTLLEQARGKAQEIGDKVMHVAGEVQHTATEKAKEEIQKQGLTEEHPGQVR